MNKVSTNITLDPILKKNAVNLLKKMRLDLSTAVTLFLNEMINEQGLPFQIRVKSQPKSHLLSAMSEANKIAKSPNKYKGYKKAEDILQDL